MMAQQHPTAACLLVLFLGSCVSPGNRESHSSPADEPNSTEWTWAYKIRQSIADKNHVEKPARLTYTNPAGESGAAAADIGVTISAVAPVTEDSRVQWEWNLGVEYHRNDAPTPRNDSMVVGINTTALAEVSRESRFFIFPSLGLDYKKDRAMEVESIIPRLNFTFINRDWCIGHAVDIPSRDNSILTFLVQPGGGVEYEDRLDAPAGSSKGGTGRLFADLSIALYPFIDELDGRLEFTASAKHWLDFAESNGVDDGRDGHDLIELGANYWLNSDRNFGIGITYRNGEDPSKGIADQELLQVAGLIKF